MNRLVTPSVVSIALWCLHAPPAGAQPATPAPVPAPAAAEGPTPAAAADADEADLDEVVDGEGEEDGEDAEEDVAARAAELADKVEELEARLAAAEQTHRSDFPVKVGGYGDLGFFTSQGDGTGFRRDIGHAAFPEHEGYAWVFYGDLLATQVNARGDVADLGDAPGVERFDSVDSGGNPTFLVNELNLSIQAGLGARALFTSSVNFTPRSGRDFALGDAFDVDLAQLEWLPTADGKTSLFVGKVDSVLGLEYKTRKASQRFGITPSLVARYTTGTAVGIKARSLLAGDHLVVAAAVTNGSFGTEQFHFYDEVDHNSFKTVSGRLGVRLDVAGVHVEVGPSGQWGTQDGAGDDAGAQWLVGVDAEVSATRFAIRGQWLRGKAPGDEFAAAYALDLRNGGYLEADVIVTPELGVFGRGELRDAQVHEGMERLYITKNWRATGGARLVLNPRAVIKVEYSHNGEYGGVPSIPDDVVASSAVIAF